MLKIISSIAGMAFLLSSLNVQAAEEKVTLACTFKMNRQGETHTDIYTIDYKNSTVISPGDRKHTKAGNRDGEWLYTADIGDNAIKVTATLRGKWMRTAKINRMTGEYEYSGDDVTRLYEGQCRKAEGSKF